MFVQPSLVCLLTLLFASASVAQLSGPTNQILVPAAGDIEGANGTHFRSDITVTNFRSTDQRVLFRWLPDPAAVPALIDPPPPEAITLTIPAHSVIASEDFMAERLSAQWRLGALLITGVTSSGEIDSGALLHATQRIWTAQPGSSGTVSQSFPILDASLIKSGSEAIILGQHIDSRFRTNAGVVNLDPTFARTFDIYQSTDDPTFAAVVTTVTLPPMTMKQVPLKDSRAKALQVTVVPRAEPAASNRWVAYASSVDNLTGDSWSNVAISTLRP